MIPWEPSAACHSRTSRFDAVLATPYAGSPGSHANDTVTTSPLPAATIAGAADRVTT